MANQATTTYKVTGTRKAVNNLWNTFQSMEVNNKNIWLSDLAKHYGIDYEAKQICVRGHIYWAEYEEDEDVCLLSFETETAWDACNDIFFEIDILTVEGYFKPEEWQDAEGVKHSRVILVATKFYEAEEKEETPVSQRTKTKKDK